jgi:hypothetical protein
MMHKALRWFGAKIALVGLSFKADSDIQLHTPSNSRRTDMTIGLIRWLRTLAPDLHSAASPHIDRRAAPDLRGLRLGPRDLADLNLPDHVAGALRGRCEAEELRRRVFR